MINLVFKEVPISDKGQVRQLAEHVIGNLERPEFFIPYADWEYDCFFEKSYGLIHGAYYEDKLVGISQLYFSDEIISEAVQFMGLSESKCCELGGNLVNPDFRKKGIMNTLGAIQLKLATKIGFDYVIALAHPDNIGSIKALDKLKFNYLKYGILSNGFERNFYLR